MHCINRFIFLSWLLYSLCKNNSHTQKKRHSQTFCWSYLPWLNTKREQKPWLNPPLWLTMARNAKAESKTTKKKVQVYSISMGNRSRTYWHFRQILKEMLFIFKCSAHRIDRVRHEVWTLNTTEHTDLIEKNKQYEKALSAKQNASETKCISCTKTKPNGTEPHHAKETIILFQFEFEFENWKLKFEGGNNLRQQPFRLNW